jgi:NADH:ubiquinone oxidoreductase subunit 3 (subunit A)
MKFPLKMPRRKLIRILNYFWLFVVFPIAVALLVGVAGHSANLGIKTFLLVEFGMAVLIPLLNAVIDDSDHTHHRRGK